jgi:hypothetical protein
VLTEPSGSNNFLDLREKGQEVVVMEEAQILDVIQVLMVVQI